MVIGSSFLASELKCGHDASEELYRQVLLVVFCARDPCRSRSTAAYSYSPRPKLVETHEQDFAGGGLLVL